MSSGVLPCRSQSAESYVMPRRPILLHSICRRCQTEYRRREMNRVRVWLAALVVLTLALPAVAQVQTGSILVRVTDEQGAGVPGVAVTLSSPVLVAGTATGITDGAGIN